eukprot:scpid67684/ scgid29505/ 
MIEIRGHVRKKVVFFTIFVGTESIARRRRCELLCCCCYNSLATAIMWRNALRTPGALQRLPCIGSGIRSWSVCAVQQCPQRFVEFSLLPTFPRDEVLMLSRSTQNNVDRARCVEAVAKEHGGVPTDVGQRVVDQLLGDLLSQCRQQDNTVGEEELKILLDNSDTRTAVLNCNHALFSKLHALLTPAVLQLCDADHLAKLTTFLDQKVAGLNVAESIVNEYRANVANIEKCLGDICDSSVLVALLNMIQRDTVTESYQLITVLCRRLIAIARTEQQTLDECLDIVHCLSKLAVCNADLLSIVLDRVTAILAEQIRAMEEDISACPDKKFLQKLGQLLYSTAYLDLEHPELFSTVSGMLDLFLDHHYKFFVQSNSMSRGALLRCCWALRHAGLKPSSILEDALALSLRRHGLLPAYGTRYSRMCSTLVSTLPNTTWRAKFQYQVCGGTTKKLSQFFPSASVPGVTTLPSVPTEHGVVDLVYFYDEATASLIRCDEIKEANLFNWQPSTPGFWPVAVLFQDSRDTVVKPRAANRGMAVLPSGVLRKQVDDLRAAGWLVVMKDTDRIDGKRLTYFGNWVASKCKYFINLEKERVRKKTTEKASKGRVRAAKQRPTELCTQHLA